MGLVGVLTQFGFEPECRAKMARHKDTRPGVNWDELVESDFFEQYQSWQAEPIFHDIDYLVSFVGDGPKRARLWCVYRVLGNELVQFADLPKDVPWPWREETPHYQYQLERISDFEPLEGQLVIEWSSERNWARPLSDSRVLECPPNLGKTIKEADSPFSVGSQYTRADVYELLGVPNDQRRGNWETGYNLYDGNLFIFCNVGASGRSGHDYNNRWLDDGRFQWFAKERTHVLQKQIQWMLHPTGNIFLFTRTDNRQPFTFEGFCEPSEHEESSPVKIVWRVHKLPLAVPASPAHRIESAREILKELYHILRQTGFSFIPEGEHNIRDVYALVRSQFPNLCDDRYLCSENCKSGYNSPEWQHKVRTALWDIQRHATVVRTTGRRGYWNFGDNVAITEVDVLLPTDIELPDTERVEVTAFRILRDTALARRIKSLHHNQCQICGLAIKLPDGSSYSEAHHIQPLGKPHDGPDVGGNIIVLCPNHHAMCDYGAIRLSHEELRQHPAHEIDLQFIDYHNSIIVEA